MSAKRFALLMVLAGLVSATTFADDLTQLIQTDLVALGYEPGNTSGEPTTATIVAISKFQADNDLEITGTASPQLAGVIKATLRTGNTSGGQASSPPSSTIATAPASAEDMAALQAAQQACLQEKVTAAQASKKKKRGFGSLMRAVTNTALRFGGGSDLARHVAETSRDVYDVNATAQDWERAAEDLGLTTDDIEACRNPTS